MGIFNTRTIFLLAACLCALGVSQAATTSLLHDANGNLMTQSSAEAVSPLIESNPVPRVGMVGGAVSFSVIANGTGPLTYQWKRDNTDIPSATASTLFLENLTVGDFAAYKVVVTNGAGSATSNEAQLVLDTDEDGLGDDWEITHFGSLTAQSTLGDADADGVSNVDEYTDGTLPNSAASRYFKLTVTGMVTVTPARMRHAPGSVVTLSAKDQAGLEFTGWTGSATGAANPLQLTMNSDKVIRPMHSALPLDNTFSPLLTSDQGLVEAMVRLPDGKFLVGGDFDAINGIRRANVARLNADWSLDTTFQGPLFAQGAFNTINSQWVKAMVLQSDGKIIIAGTFVSLNGTACRIARLLSNGEVDPTFVGPTILGSSAVIEGLAVQPDDKILFFGRFLTVGGISRLNVARLMPGGAVDTTFNTSTGPNNYVHKVVWQGPDKILIGGDFTQVGATSRNRIARLTDTGALDTTFDPGTGANGDVNAMLVDSAGRILLGGDFSTFNGTDAEPLVRLFDNGSRDMSFNCIYTTPPGKKWEFVGPVNDLIEEPDGKIIAGYCGAYRYTTIYEEMSGPMRFTSTGELDASFAPAFSPWSVLCMLRDGNGDLRFGGEFTTINGVPAFNLGRLTAANEVPGPPSSATRASSGRFLPLPDGRSLVFGEFALVNGAPRDGIAKLMGDGSVDPTFVPGNSVYDGYYYGNEVRAAAIQSDGKVVMAGRIWVGGNGRPVVRLNGDGSLDTGFTAPTAISINTVYDLAVQSDGKIVVGGWFTSTTPVLENLARLETNGTLDSTFTAVADSSVYSVDVAADDRLLIGGAFTTVNGLARKKVAILTAGGQLDGTFSTGSEPSSSSPRVLQARFIDGLVAMTGPFSYTGQIRSGVAVLSPSGALDPNRNTGGLLTSFGSPTEACLSPRSNGGLWVGGTYTLVDGVSRKYMVPLLPSGALDADIVNDLQVPNGPVYTIHEASNGDVVVSGLFAQAGGIDRFGLARYVTTNRVEMGTLATVPSGPQFTIGSNLEMTVSAGAVSGAVGAVEMEVSTNGRQFTYLTGASPIANNTWQATGSIVGAGTFYLRATAIHSNGSRRSSYAIGPFEAVPTPVITSAALAMGLINQPFSYTATATGVPLTNFTATNLPAWATFAFQSATNDALLSGTPNAVGETNVGLTAANASGNGNGTVKIQIFDTYENWKTTQFTLAEQGDPLLSGPDADFDHDGLSNRLEFSLRSNPKTSDLAAVPGVSVNTYGANKYLTLTYRRYKWAGQTSFRPEVSGELSAWNSGASFTTEVSRSDNGDGTETVVVRDNVIYSSAQRRFIRLNVQTN